MNCDFICKHLVMADKLIAKEQPEAYDWYMALLVKKRARADAAARLSVVANSMTNCRLLKNKYKGTWVGSQLPLPQLLELLLLSEVIQGDNWVVLTDKIREFQKDSIKVETAVCLGKCRGCKYM